MRKFFLGEVVRDVDAIAGRLTETVCEAEQGFRHSGRHIAEDQVGQDVVGTAQPLRQRLQELDGDVWPPVIHGNFFVSQ